MLSCFICIYSLTEESPSIVLTQSLIVVAVISSCAALDSGCTYRKYLYYSWVETSITCYRDMDVLIFKLCIVHKDIQFQIVVNHIMCCKF